ncbi:hypothetical protein FRACYDRAFT_238526 [Fragilariopsis cylindrus CCMP1102]|uniref:BTB domain-containing protein n=1 Tax=Fragilariopsis cylindrus CCMP1102 TaxID=635003 RepID=A0A1E7FIT6_9STRA|nr:hypothetical protein FRACYDRAFT_238526 [Fragilariopsis cylindrus CCMP1102]|eukprot:OEU18092.1 hypothetical protein FRACYDRAFT_238526 [Fragilariopsis cylindrus CCMP1102]
MEESTVSNDDDKKRKRSSSINSFDRNVYLVGTKNCPLDYDSEDSDDSEGRSNKSWFKGFSEDKSWFTSKRSWFKGLCWTKSPEEAAKYSDWSLDVKRQDATDYGTVVEKKIEEAMVATKVPFRNDTLLDAKDSKKTADGTVITYSVHRNILELHSDYFKGIFGRAFRESNKKRNIIKLPTSVVTLQHFETFLNYCYTGKLKLHSNNAVAMVYFGDYLDDKELSKRGQNFIWYSIKNASGEDLSAYYRDAKGLLMEDLQKAIEHICARRPKVMSVNTALSKIPDLQFWCNVWEARKHYQNEFKFHSKQWSENAVHFIQQHRDIIDVSAFRVLTDIDSLPIISPDAAVSLMEQEQELKLDDSTKANRATLTCLQKRCTEALYDRIAGNWRVSKKDDLLGRLKRLPSVVLDTIISWTIQYKGVPTGIEVSGAGHDDATVCMQHQD